MRHEKFSGLKAADKGQDGFLSENPTPKHAHLTQ